MAVIKTQTGRMRPDGSDLRSFPSGHAKAAAQIAVGLALLVAPARGTARRCGCAAAAWIVVMSWSRTALDAHFLSDVVAGAAIGGGVALCAWGVAHGGLATGARPRDAHEPAGHRGSVPPARAAS